MPMMLIKWLHTYQKAAIPVIYRHDFNPGKYISYVQAGSCQGKE